MAYEYSSDQKQLDFPNPYRVENMLWAVRAGTLVLCALVLLLVAREHLAAQEFGRFAVPLATGVGLFVGGAWNLVRIGRQLKVFFGRGQPAGLARELEGDATGDSSEADALRQVMRHGALPFAVPSGALNGVLYSLVGDLITAPPCIQRTLQARFSNLASYALLLLAMGVTQAFVRGSPAQGWVGAFFLALVLFMAVRPMSERRAGRRVRFDLGRLVALLLVALLGPVLLGLAGDLLPDLSWASFGAQAFAILCALLAIETVFFVAVRRHIDPPPPVSKVDTVATVSFNSDPNLLMQELDRELQRNWASGIPNRRYARRLPRVALHRQSGNFRGFSLEETQPLPAGGFERMDWSVVRAYPRFFWLMVIDVLGIALTIAGALALVAFALRFDPSADWRAAAGLASLGAALVTVGGYAFRSAHTLWGRFDFESTLTWVELDGSFVRSRIDVGNRLQDRVFTERSVVSVESMTLRVWVMRLRSVVFDHHGAGGAASRAITAMVGDPDQARYLKQCIERFAADQSIVLAPASQEDARRLSGIDQAGRWGRGEHPGHALPRE